MAEARARSAGATDHYGNRRRKSRHDRTTEMQPGAAAYDPGPYTFTFRFCSQPCDDLWSIYQGVKLSVTVRSKSTIGSVDSPPSRLIGQRTTSVAYRCTRSLRNVTRMPSRRHPGP